ncbi:hypothetical protein [Motiliproteus coralliicola]|uniref:hypothetical protein n=1 Tax=Motiliproteus coralliicola TaxID=2283196 RepID=UPI00105853B7|nr:hypothetical protein [Motiliproteus coralliicola]
MSESTQEILRKYQFIVLAPNNWNGQWMNRQQLFSRIAPYSNVIYSQGIPSVWELSSPAQLLKHPFSNSAIYDSAQIDKPSSLLFHWPRLKRISRWAIKQHSRTLAAKFNNRSRRVLYVFHPNYAHYIDTIKHDLLIYHPYDDFSKQGAHAEQLSQQEGKLLKQADLVITPSSDVSCNMAQRSGRDDIKTIKNGVDFDAFSQSQQLQCPEDLARITGPTIGYIGSINVKVDLNLLDFLAEQLPHVQQILIGPIGNLTGKGELFNQLTNRPNVHCLGAKDYRRLPAYAGHIDCHLMCYDTSPTLWARLAYPLKLNEYLATKKPLISCPLSSVEDQEQLMDVCSTPQQWLEAINQRLSQTSEKLAAGYQYASQQSWDRRVQQLATLLSSAKADK